MTPRLFALILVLWTALWAVAPTSQARPQLFSLPPIPAQTATSYQMFVMFVDYVIEDPVCFEGMSFQLEDAPAGMDILSASGFLYWLPTAVHEEQAYDVTIKATGIAAPWAPCYSENLELTVGLVISVVPGFVDVDQDGISDFLEHSLMVEHAPQVRLHPSDIYRPSSVPWYLSRVHMRYNHNNCSDDQILNKGSVTATNIDGQSHEEKNSPLWFCSHNGQVRYSDERTFRSRFFLQIPNDASEFTTRRGAPADDWTCYAHVRRAPGSTAAYDIQYWFFYPYNGNLAGLGSHEGDWEHITVRVLDNGLVDHVYFAAHNNEGRWYPPSQTLTTPDGRTVVYSADDSHASYPWPGTWHRTYPLPSDHTAPGGPIWDCKDSVVNVGEANAPLAPGSDWLYYSGRWGEIGPFFSGPWGPAYQSKWNDDGPP